MRRSRAGLTLLEVMIAVGLLSFLSLGILLALRIGLNALEKANRKLMADRRIAGAQRILQDQLAGFMPVVGQFSPSPDAPTGQKFPFFEGRAQSMRFVSSYSLGEAARGLPEILEFQVIPADAGGVRLVVNENVYTGPRSAGRFSLGPGADPELGVGTMRYLPITIGPGSFVIADRLAYCRFAYYGVQFGSPFEQWKPGWAPPDRWPMGIRIEMASLDTNPGNLKPLTISVPVHVDRFPIYDYMEEEENQ